MKLRSFKLVVFSLAACASISAQSTKSQQPRALSPQIIAGDRHATVYSDMRVTVEKNAQASHTLTITTPQGTFQVQTNAELKDPTALQNFSWTGALTPKKTEALATGEITSFPLQDVDLLGVEISTNITAAFQYTASAKKLKPARALVVFQGVAIDPNFVYQSFMANTFDYVVVENALFQSEQITQAITHPSQALVLGQHEITPPPSHDVLFDNALSRALMPQNAKSTKHKILLMYASDLDRLSTKDIKTLSQNNWFLAILGSQDRLSDADIQKVAPFGINCIVVNALGKTLDRVRECVVFAYIATIHPDLEAFRKEHFGANYRA